MKKLISLLALVLAVTITACEEVDSTPGTSQGSVSSTVQVGEISWEGEDEITVVLGDSVDLLEGLSAQDTIDGDLTDKITVKDVGGFDKNLVGGYDVVYEVKNSTNITSEFTRAYTVVQKHNVGNGQFDLGAYGWTFDKPGGAATFTVKDGAGVVTITSPGNEWWALQLYQAGVVLEGGYDYMISFDAKGENRASISAGFENINAGYAMMSNGMLAVSLTEEMTTYTMYLHVPETVTNAKMVIYMGYQLPGDEASEDEPSIITIDDVNVSKLTISEDAPTFIGVENVTITAGIGTFDPFEGVEAKDKDGNTLEFTVTGEVPNSVRANGNYIVSYRVKDANNVFKYYNRTVRVNLPKDHDYEVVNGDFSLGLTAWTQDVNQTNGTGKATFIDNEDGTVSINVTDVSNANWHIQLFQGGIKLQANQKYLITARVKADVNRNIEIELSDPGAGFAVFGYKKISLTNEFQTFYVPVETDKDYAAAKLAFLLGSIDGATPGTITVDEFQISQYSPRNSEFTTTHEPWRLDNITAEIVTEDDNGVLVVTFEENAVGNAPWNNQLYHDGLTLKPGLRYKISVKMKSSIDRDIRVWIEDVNKGYAAISTDNTYSLVADEYQVCEFTVDITEGLATTNAKFVIMFGDSGAKAAHTVTVDYFRVEIVPAS